MSKRIEAKHKIDRRLGENLWGRPGSPLNARAYGPGQHGQRRKGKTSDYGLQLRAKQKLKGYYGNITEKAFKKLYTEAARIKGDTGERLIGLLESRLDAVVYRAKFVATVFAARQFVSHGHILVNGKRVNIPSYQVKPGDRIEVRETRKAREPFKLAKETLRSHQAPEWLSLDAAKLAGTVADLPRRDQMPLDLNEQLVVEYYSR